MNRTICLLLCLSMALNSYAQSLSTTDFIDKTDKLVNEAWDMGIFSGSVAVAHKGQFAYQKTFGFADWNGKKPFTSQTLFDIGSINKRFTEELVRQLVKEQKISLYDPLSKHLPLFSPDINDKITIQQLIEMRSGLGDYLTAPGFAKREREGGLTLQERLEYIKKQPLLFEPGKGQAYSNSGYVVLGALIEKITGKSYSQNLEERIFQPLHLSNILYKRESIQQHPQRALGAKVNFKGEKMAIDDVWNDASPDGGLYADMNNLMAFAWAAQSGTLPSGTKYPPHPIAGGSNYWNTIIFPANDSTTLIIMSNLENIADELGMRLYDLSKGKQPKPLTYPGEMRLYKDLNEKGIAFIEKNIKSITASFELEYDHRFLNFFGYRFLNGGDTDAGLALFELNTRLFPEVANTYDSLAEAWLKKGNKEQAKKYYLAVLQLDPNNKHAKEKLQQIQ